MVMAEIELKFHVRDAAKLRQRVLDAGFLLQTERTFESNTLFDTPERSLRGRQQILRLRQYGETWTLTHKRPTDDERERESLRYKFRQETETHVDDGEAMGAILIELGYLPVFRYEKFRTEFVDAGGSGSIVLDETPIGTFAEAEGSPAWIEETLQKLGVRSKSCFTESYGKMFEQWQQHTGSNAQNMAFAEVEAAEAEMAKAATTA
jgi:adenylate cyclase class 2